MNSIFLSNINIEPLKTYFPDANFIGYGRALFELLNDDTILYTEEHSMIVIHMDGDELLKSYIYDIEKNTSDIEETIENLLRAIEKSLKKNSNTLHLLSTIVIQPLSFMSYIKSSDGNSMTKIVEDINRQIRQFALMYNNLCILDFYGINLLYGYNRIQDQKFWYLGRIKYSNIGYRLIAEEINNIRNAYLGKIAKVLVLDLDNTLWGGVIGEDGVSGIQLSEEGIGKAYRDFQQAIKSCMKLGVILAISSKNNEDDVKEAFNNHPMMILKYDDFIIKKINWESKVNSIIEISQELNLGLDSLIFIDDNDHERNYIKEGIPEVIVPDFPADIANLKNWFFESVVYKYFPKIYLTEEDIKKNQQYKQNIERNRYRAKLDLESFIEGLDIKLTYYLNDKKQIGRMAQLTQKTNQFNLTNHRYTESEIEHFMDSDDTDVYGLKYEDKYGQEGIVGEIIIKKNQLSAEIDIFLLSCRIIGRNVEKTFVQKIIQDLKEAGIREIKAIYKRTKKNVIVENLYSSLGFEPIENNTFIMRL